MSNEVLFHGSNAIVEKPQILQNGFYKDFGYGFYCTRLEKQAKRWALTKRNNHIVNEYLYDENVKLKIKKFDEVKFKYPTHQIVFCTEEALRTLKFEGSYSL